MRETDVKQRLHLRLPLRELVRHLRAAHLPDPRAVGRRGRVLEVVPRAEDGEVYEPAAGDRVDCEFLQNRGTIISK